MTEKLKTASVLAFERKFVNSDGLMFAGNWKSRHSNEHWEKINLREKSVRGTISNRLKITKDSDSTKLNPKIKDANLQTIDVAALPSNCDTLKINFTLRVLGDLAVPCACDKPDYQKELADKINGYINRYQFQQLAERYAENIANGRFLWRNRVGAEAIEIKVNHHDNVWTFDAESYKLRNFSENTSEDLKKLVNIISNSLKGNKANLLEVEAFVKLGKGQEVFPSQELILEKSNNKNGKKSKFLYEVEGAAAMHSQKIGNAIRTIDTWYSNSDEFGPIPIEPYGSVTNRGQAYRRPKDKNDFYTLLDNWILKDKELSENEQHYVIACLIRGGVFGESSKDKGND